MIFDLDGTLVDSRRDLIACVNAVLSHEQLRPLADDVIAGFIGNGAGPLVDRSLEAAGAPQHVDRAAALNYFLDYYRERLLDHTRPYPGVLHALAELHNLSDRPQMAVLTNKPVGPSRRICDALDLSPYFFANYGGNSFATKKPDPQGLRSVWNEAERHFGHPLLSGEVVMIGDSEVDVQTGRNAGVRSVGCTWGFAPDSMLAEDPDLVATTPADWARLLF